MRLHAHEYGDPAGAPVICLHGVTGHGERFRRLGEGALSRRRVIAPDLRGHGRSGWSPPWSTEAHAADALETADALGVQSADWIGYSFGARVVARIAAHAAPRVRRVVYLDPAFQLAPEVCLQGALDELEPGDSASVEEAIEARLRTGTLLHTPRELLEEDMRQHLVRGEDNRLRARYSRPAAIAAWSEMAAAAPPPARVPTLIVRGERSWVTLDDQVERFRARLEGELSLASVPGGHSLLWDALEETSAVVARFLES